jgi:hypothetical protein
LFVQRADFCLQALAVGARRIDVGAAGLHGRLGGA